MVTFVVLATVCINSRPHFHRFACTWTTALHVQLSSDSLRALTRSKPDSWLSNLGRANLSVASPSFASSRLNPRASRTPGLPLFASSFRLNRFAFSRDQNRTRGYPVLDKPPRASPQIDFSSLASRYQSLRDLCAPFWPLLTPVHAIHFASPPDNSISLISLLQTLEQ